MISDSRVKRIAVVTVGRSDFGLLLPVLRLIQADPGLDLRLLVTGSHLVPTYGSTIDEIMASGLCIDEKIEMLLGSDSDESISKSMALGVLGFAQSYARHRPDILLGLGDRFELLAAVLAALPSKIPVAHISGGETTEGAIDDSIRHAITKLSHLHFVAAAPYAQRVIQMGEEPWRVHVTGEPGLDDLTSMDYVGKDELERRVGMSLTPDSLIVTFHPVTLESTEAADHIRELLAALTEVSRPIVFTYPNADAGSHEIIEAIEKYVSANSNARAVRNLGRRIYCSLLKQSAAMVGNSSSGIVEAASFELPVVNIGNRQKGRLAAPNVIHCPANRKAIRDAISKATSFDFRTSIRGIQNLYGDGHASERIVRIMKEVSLDQRLIVKRFHDAH